MTSNTLISHCECVCAHPAAAVAAAAVYVTASSALHATYQTQARYVRPRLHAFNARWLWICCFHASTFVRSWWPNFLLHCVRQIADPIVSALYLYECSIVIQSSNAIFRNSEANTDFPKRKFRFPTHQISWSEWLSDWVIEWVIEYAILSTG